MSEEEAAAVEEPQVRLTARDMLCVWDMSEHFRPANGVQTDCVAELRAKIRPLVAEILSRERESRGRRE